MLVKPFSAQRLLPGRYPGNSRYDENQVPQAARSCATRVGGYQAVPRSIPNFQAGPDLLQVPATGVAAQPDGSAFEGVRLAEAAGARHLLEILLQVGAGVTQNDHRLA